MPSSHQCKSVNHQTSQFSHHASHRLSLPRTCCYSRNLPLRQRWLPIRQNPETSPDHSIEVAAAQLAPPVVPAIITLRRAGPGGESNPALPKSNPSSKSGGQCMLHALLHSSLQCVFVPPTNSGATHLYYYPLHVLCTLAAFNTREFHVSHSLLGSANFGWIPGLGFSRTPATRLASPFDLQPLHLDRNRLFSMFSCFPLSSLTLP